MTNSQKRKYHAVGGPCDDSDEEVEIDTSAAVHAPTGKITIHHHRRVVSKSAKAAEEGEESPLTPSDDGGISMDRPLTGTTGTVVSNNPAEEKQKKKQGASVIMEKFSRHFDVLQSAILFSTQYHRSVGQKCACGLDDAAYRCTGQEKCSDPPLRCKSCIVNDHKRLPFHRIEKWVGTHFKATSLSDLGFVLCLGHYGHECPNRSSKTIPRPMVAVHTNGFHKLSVLFCYCDFSISEPVQLARECYFPGTMEQPRTIFSFGVLDNFHLHTLSSKKSLYDYHDTLCKMTNAAFPQDSPIRYTEFGQVARVWAHLAMKRRSGQSHNIDEKLELKGASRRKESIAVRCPACPDVGVNVSKKTIEKAREDEAHKYTLFISADGNFRLQRKNKNDDPDDIALNKGNAYFVETSKYNEYLKGVPDTNENSTCSHLRANRLLNVIAFKNAVVSGVVAIQCARHGLFLPQGMVDLVKGEAYARTDYALANALSDAESLRWLMLCYDIWCSYQANLRKRFAKYFPREAALLQNLRGAVPKMHVKNHVAACQLLWAFNYILYSGETYGEQIESSWGEGNQAAGSTKEMNDGHRHDALDDFHGYWNWTKVHKLSATIMSSYIKCLNTLKCREKNFQDFNQCIDPAVLRKWKAIDPSPRMENGTVVSVHVTQHINGPPTQLSAYKKLTDEAKKKANEQDSDETDDIGPVQVINVGLNIEDTQAKVRLLAAEKSPKPADVKALADARQSLRRELDEWRSNQLSLLPNLTSEIKAADVSTPENEKLYLPSSFSEQRRIKLGLTEFSKIEYDLREGRAHDALEDLRTAIKVFNVNLDFKKNQVFGYGPNTRAQVFLRELHNDKAISAATYRIAREGLLALGLPEDDPILQDLEDDQLWGKDTSRLAGLGDSKKEDPWFWHVGRPRGLTKEEKEEWSLESDRVKWFRDKSARDRAQEEKEILEEEIRRCIKYYQFMKDIWISMANSTDITNPGHAPYAYKQAEMYGRLAEESAVIKAKMNDKKKVYDKWLQDYEPQARRPAEKGKKPRAQKGGKDTK